LILRNKKSTSNQITRPFLKASKSQDHF